MRGRADARQHENLRSTHHAGAEHHLAGGANGLALALLEDLNTNGARSFEALSAWSTYQLPLTGEGEPEEVVGAEVATNHFDLLGVQPMLGRSFQNHEEVPGEGHVAMISHSLWQRRFGSDPDVLGTTVELGIPGELPYTIVGVMPRGYRPIAGEVDMWAPLTIDPEDFSDYSGTARYSVGGRLAEGVSLEEARAEVKALVAKVIN